MLEGQSGLNWDRWQRLALAVEALGFAGLYRSDHLINAQLPDEDSIDAWVSLTWLASHTSRIEFGTLASPLSFRHPVHLARMASALDDLSGGRLTLGVGAGWSRREHEVLGFELLPPNPRLDRLEEGIQVITRLLRSDVAVSFDGCYFQLRDALLLPRPRRVGGPRLLVAGRGRKRSLPIAARYADEWNAMFISPEMLREMNTELDDLLELNGKQPDDLKRTVMQGVEIGRNEAELRQKLEARAWQFWREPGLIAGSNAQMQEQLAAFAAAGAQRIMLQWQDQDDLDGLERLSRAVL
jgi:alkanesulfonate monooxygenase SsuD/methylene tetrahydromethanopterin reductase-like flavin-dependent oxidoreductase (luciferase family)